MTTLGTAHRATPRVAAGAAVAYGLAVYAAFLVTFLYAIAFIADATIEVASIDVVPRTIDRGGPPSPVGSAVPVDLLLLSLFAVQHSVMARQGFKRWWTRGVPPVAERSTYVLFATGCLALLMVLWRPIPYPVWDITSGWLATTLLVISLLGWALVLASTFLISHTDLFGLRQVVAALRRRRLPPQRLVTPLWYRLVRHPIYLGFAIAFWATATMSVGHLIFAIASTGYLLVGIQFEERDLVRSFGAGYRDYRRRVGMLLPRRPRS